MSAQLLAQTRLQDKAKAWRDKYSKPQTFATLYIDATEQQAIAKQFEANAAQIGNITSTLRNAAKANALNLLKLRGVAGAGEPSKDLPASVLTQAADYLSAPIEWLMSVSGPVLDRQEKINKVGQGIVELPQAVGKGIGDLLAALLKPLMPLLYLILIAAIIIGIVYLVTTYKKVA